MIPANRSLDATIRIKRADGVWVDITEFVKSVRPHRGDISSVGTGSSGVDAGVLQCEVVIVNDTENHFSPLDKNSSWNQLPDGSYAPLVWPNREIDVKVQTESPVVKFISDDISQGTLNDVEVDAEGHLVLSVAGVDLSYTEDTQADFQAGTLADVAATPGGSLVLAKEGEDFTYTETTQADFEQGILDGVAATSVGDLELKKYDGLKFDGSTNYINTSNFTTPNAFTITAEIKLTQYPSDTNVGCIINSSYNSGIGYIFYVASDGRIGLRGHDPNHVPTSYDVKSNYVITLNQPTRIDITYDGATTKIFVNKVLDYQTPSWFTAQRTAFVTGKAAWASSNYFKGEMYAVSVWSRALTQAEITDEQELLGNEAGLVLHYALDEIGGRDVYDSTANSYNGYAYGTNVYWITVYEPSGNRVSPAIDLSATGIASDSAISWAETLNAQSIVVESNLALDGVNYAGWQLCTNGGAIPGVTSGADLSAAKLQLRETLATSDPMVTPQLHELALSITSTYKTSGSRIAPPIPLDAVGVARGSTISWQATDGVVIETSLDGGQVWDAPVNGGAIPGVDNQDLAGKSLLVRQTLTTSDITQTPSLDSLSLTLQTGYNLIGSRVSPVYDISSLGTAMTSAVSWQSDEPVGTVVAVDASVNGGAWKSVTNGDTIADIAEGMDLTGATLQFKITEITTDAEVRPSLEKLSCTVQGYKDGLWTIFQGYLGDSINMDGHQVSALCRDPSKRLEDCYIESAQAYGTEAGTPAETVLQEMLDNNLGTGVVTLYCPVSPGFMVTDYTVEYTSLWQAMKTLVQQFGWFLGYFTDSNGNFILCLIEPPRDKNQYTADLTLDYMDDFYDPSTLNISDADIRNVIIVTYRDKATNERKRVVLEDPDSIAQFGRKVMLIEEADTSEINTDEEARDMGAAALYDLKNITGTHKLPMPFVPTVDIFTGINRWDPRISSTVDFFGVESVEHTLDFQNHRFRTQVVGAGKVIGGRASWLEMQVRPGANAAIHAGQVLQGILDAGSAAIVAKGNGGYVVIDKNGQKFVAADGAITIEFNTETGEGFFSGRVVGAVYGE